MANFDLSLERNQYAAGETAKGTLIISAEKDFKVRGFEFSVSGEERIEMKLEESYGINAYYSINATTTTTYKESNIFFSKDLSHFLNSIGTKIGAEHDDNILEVAGGNWKVPFEFSIPEDALESYDGKCAKIIYKIEVAANRAWRQDVDANLSFTVFNQKRKYMKFDRAITEEIKERRNSEEINGRRNSSIRLNLEEDNNTFSPGETIRGKITIENFKKLKIRKIQTILGAIEFAQAQRKKKRTEIFPKYEQQTIKWNEGNNSGVVPFEVHIPKEIRCSYLGKYSEYYCLLEAKVDIPWSDDLYDRAIIQIV
jgi:Arrestin (or S-antigen), N-terminal domain